MSALTICKKCLKTVPRTMTCIYCGSPILYRHITEKMENKFVEPDDKQFRKMVKEVRSVKDDTRFARARRLLSMVEGISRLQIYEKE